MCSSVPRYWHPRGAPAIVGSRMSWLYLYSPRPLILITPITASSLSKGRKLHCSSWYCVSYVVKSSCCCWAYINAPWRKLSGSTTFFLLLHTVFIVPSVCYHVIHYGIEPPLPSPTLHYCASVLLFSRTWVQENLQKTTCKERRQGTTLKYHYKGYNPLLTNKLHCSGTIKARWSLPTPFCFAPRSTHRYFAAPPFFASRRKAEPAALPTP